MLRLSAVAEREEASERGRRMIDAIVLAGEKLGLEVVREHPVPGGRLDVVWLWRTDTPPLSDLGPLPLAAFEVESSWRSRKHVKGSYLNLLDVGAALGVIILAGEGTEIESLRHFAKRLVARPGSRIEIWSDADVEALVEGRPLIPNDAAAEVKQELEEDTESVEAPGSSGKYTALTRWLSEQQVPQLTLSFVEIEEVLGQSLPPSSRHHVAHWYGYKGSRVARAIIDAGWKASRADLAAERVTLTRQR